MKLEISQPTIIDKEDFILPGILYKYRDWNDKFHKRLITHRELYYSSPAKFEDKHDCKNWARWDLLTHTDILDKYFQDSLLTHPEFDSNERMEFAIKWANNTPLKDKDFVAQQEKKTFEMFKEYTGILSLTEYPKEFKMWEKYSNSHTGFCIGYNAKALFEILGTGGGPVLYHEELPTIYPSPIHSFIMQTVLQIFNKLECWSFEKEYRTYIFRNRPLTNAERNAVIPPEVFKEILLGAMMSESDEQSLINSIPNELAHIQIKKAHLKNGEISIEDYFKKKKP